MRLGAEKIATGHYARVRQNPATAPRAAQGPGPGQGPELLPAPPEPGAAVATLFPGGRAAQDRGAPHRRRDRPAEREEEGLHRHLLHRRAAVPRVPEPLHQPPARPDQGRPRPHARPARGPELLHPGPAPGAGHRRREGERAQPPAGGGDHAPWFVARKDLDRNTLWVVQGHDHPWLLSHALVADDASWVAGEPPAPGATAPRPATARPMPPAGWPRWTRGAFSLQFDQRNGPSRPASRRAVRRRGLPGRRRRSSRRLTGMGRATSVAPQTKV
jgi:tRNA-specific 2-thiouridylase